MFIWKLDELSKKIVEKEIRLEHYLASIVLYTFYIFYVNNLFYPTTPNSKTIQIVTFSITISAIIYLFAISNRKQHFIQNYFLLHINLFTKVILIILLPLFLISLVILELEELSNHSFFIYLLVIFNFISTLLPIIFSIWLHFIMIKQFRKYNL